MSYVTSTVESQNRQIHGADIAFFFFCTVRSVLNIYVLLVWPSTATRLSYLRFLGLRKFGLWPSA
jgi:hypothetical protein